VSMSDVLCLEGVNDRLWAGGWSGLISVYDDEVGGLCDGDREDGAGCVCIVFVGTRMCIFGMICLAWTGLVSLRPFLCFMC
jgi:hypothetical protein